MRELLEGSRPRNMAFNTIKIPKVAVSELPNVQELEGTLRPSSRSSALSNNDFDLKQDLGPRNTFVIKQQPLELSSTGNNGNAEDLSRRRHFILEI